MSKSILTIALAAALTASTGCATMSAGGATTNKGQVAKATLKGGGLGCALGALTSILMKSDAKEGCVAGAVVGAVQAGVAEHRRQVAAARQLADEAEQAGVTATVTTKSVTVDDKGKRTQTDGLDKLTLTMSSADIQSRSAETHGVLVKAARLSDQSSVVVTIRVEGTKAQRAWMTDVLRQSLKSGSRTKIVEADARTPRLIISPMPVVEASHG